NPVVVADRRRGRAWVTWSGVAANGSLDVYAKRVDAIEAVRVSPPEGRRGADQFWPASGVDERSGRLWLCFYDTRGDPRRVRSWYSCTASRDGGRTWPRPVRVASVASDEAQPGAANGADQRQY